MSYDERSAWAKKIEETYYRFFRKRDERAPQSERQGALRWHALEELLLEAGEPEFFDTVELDQEPCMVVEIAGAVSLITVSEEAATVRSVGPLGGGIYEERVSIGSGGDYAIEGSFTHPNLPGTLVVRASNWDAMQRTRETRAHFRSWAQSARVARVQTFPIN